MDSMSKFAVVKLGVAQYNLEEGKEYTLPKFSAELGKFNINEVLLAGENDSIVVGKPFVEKASVELEVLDQGKGEKVTSSIFKAKSRYRKTRGFRKSVTTIKVISIKY